MKRIRSFLLPLLLLALLPAAGVQAREEMAREISAPGLVTAGENLPNPAWLFNGDCITCQSCKGHVTMTLSHEEGIGSLYLIFNVSHGPFRVIEEDTGREQLCGEENFLHDFVDVAGIFGRAPKSITLDFGDHGLELNELRAFTAGEPPRDVQRWKLAPEEGVDLLVFPTHGDDEQLFFAGMLPWYAGEKGYEVQVAYSTDHHNLGLLRPHEMLNGLWETGVTNYPVFGPFPDYLTKNENNALQAIQPAGFEEEDVLSYVVEQIRKFKPLVVAGHDLKGEYGHGFHRLYGRMVTEAVEVSMDPLQFPESAEKYGTWDVPKTYIHLYPQNTLHMNWDIPTKRFDGLTAYEVCKHRGYPAHKSQYKGFAWYFAGFDTADSIEENSPCDYGLYRSTVGLDMRKDDLFENLLCREEMQKKKEAERLAREAELQRQKAEQLKKEKEAAEKAAAEAASREADRITRIQQTQEAQQRRQKVRVLFASGAAGASALALLLVILFRKVRK